MKRLDYRRRAWLRHRQTSEMKKRKRPKQGRKPPMVAIETPEGAFQAVAKRSSVMPPVLCFDRNPEETIVALASLRRSLNRPRPIRHRSTRHGNSTAGRLGTYRSFEEIKSITPASALIIAAEYERIKKFNPDFILYIANIDRWDPSVCRLLQEIGFFRLVGFNGRAPTRAYEGNFTLLPMRSGETADSPTLTQMIRDLRGLFPSDSGSLDGLVHLYGAMTEALVNVVRHAYPANGEFQYRPIGKWWMTGAVDRQAKWMTAVVYDQGVTIPVSLSDWQEHAGWRRRLTAMLGVGADPTDPKYDGEAIAAAVEESVSSTGDAHRGHGLAQMRDFVDQCRDGHLRVISRGGEVIFRPGGSRTVRTYNHSIGGTLIEWNVLL